MAKKLGLVDLGSVFAPAWHSGKDKELGHAFEASLDTVYRFSREVDHVAICCDGPPYWRKEVCPSYKANRPPPEPNMLDQLRRVEERLERDGFTVWKCVGYEADDVIATAVRIAEDDRVDVLIASSDKDLLQLVNDETAVSVYSLASRTRYDAKAVHEKFGVWPDRIRDLLALTGDSSDGIPGAKGVGIVNAAKLLNTHGGYADVLAATAKEPPVFTPAMRKNLIDGVDAVRLAYKLVELKDDAPINFAEALRGRPEPEPSPQQEDTVPENESSPETTAVQVASPQQSAALARREEFEMSVEQLLERVEKIRSVRNRIMRRDTHYGKIPGVDKDALLKPGAELLCMTFRLSPEFSPRHEQDGEHREYWVTCRLVHAATGICVGSGLGSCSTRESKYAYRKASRKCPKCGKETIFKSKNGEGWYCWRKKDGCGAQFPDGSSEIESQVVGRVGNPDLADQYNTVLKMACKRALVAAVLNVTGASEIFTQDVEEANDNDSAYSESYEYGGGYR